VKNLQKKLKFGLLRFLRFLKKLQKSRYLTLSLPLATKVDRTPSVPLATGIALFTNVRVWSLISLT